VNQDQPVSYNQQALYNLLPEIYRQRDIDLGLGQPLYALLGVIAQQVSVIENDIENLYNNWFIETCDPWLVPYIGDLVGATLRSNDTTGTINRRSFVGNLISYRRRKGTSLVMEEFAKDITGWYAKAVEFFQILETTQNFNHPRLSNFRTVCIRNNQQLEQLNTPFDSITHSPEVRNISSEKGLYNIPNVGLFLYRLLALPANSSPAFPVDSTNQHFTFDPLGRDIQLYNLPATESGSPQPAGLTNVPIPITRLDLTKNFSAYYGGGQSFLIMLGGQDGSEVPENNIQVCDLSGWINTPSSSSDQLVVAVDPVLGRLAFSQPRSHSAGGVYVNYHYGFSAEMGGGFYERPQPDPDVDPTKQYLTIPISQDGSSPIAAALHAWKPSVNPNVILQIQDSEIYDDKLSLVIPAGCSVEITAAQGVRPIIQSGAEKISIKGETPGPNIPEAKMIFDGVLFDKSPVAVLSPKVPAVYLGEIAANPANFLYFLESSLDFEWAQLLQGWQTTGSGTGTVVAASGGGYNVALGLSVAGTTTTAVLSVNGTVVCNFGVKLEQNGDYLLDLNPARGLGSLVLRHCTLVPDEKPSLTVDSGNDDLVITIDNSISGQIATSKCEASVNITNSIVDGIDDQALDAYQVTIQCTTIFGRSKVTLINLVSDSIFRDPIIATRVQSGCVRFSYIPKGSRVPHPYRCQPQLSQTGDSDYNRAIALKLMPRFTSVQYGEPGYGQLYKVSRPEIFQGADNGNEMGAFNSLLQAVRLTNLKSTLSDFTRFGLETGIFMVS
jgi:hypothetical protein